MLSFYLATAALGVSSIVWAEIIRDVYHFLAHIWQPLYKQHVWHHRVFRQDLSIVSDEIYRKAQWHNDLPESLVMLVMNLGFWYLCFLLTPIYHWGSLLGIAYTLIFLISCIARGSGSEWAKDATDLTHMPGAFTELPAQWLVNRPYHWRHHFDDDKAYYSGTLTFVDKVMGTALSLKGKKIAVTGASGTLGRSLLKELYLAGARVTALSSKSDPVNLIVNSEEISIKTIAWQTGEEENLTELFRKIDILILNHGINVHGDRTAEAISKSYEVNTFSSWRLMELFLSSVRTNKDIATKEVWVNTSEAEVLPAVSPLYELSKRTLGDLVTLRRLDSPCVVRKLILGPFKSNLNPIGIMSSDRVAKQIVALAKRDFRNIIVTINPLTYLLIPIKEFFTSIYFRFFSRRANQSGVVEVPKVNIKQ
ncbi:MAG: bifunctional sterol desaturase/short chain dehydrogenase [Cyanobacteria bacterium P01_A01_bin.45]